MSGTSIPYHLRTNKAIDRDIFFELLGRLKLPETIQNYNYISLGGPMLEDLRLLHQRMNMNKLTSLEKDSAVLTRQEFNKPYSCISCKKSSTNEYINQLNPSSPSIIWLDYTKTNWSTQFQECHTLLSKLNVFDVIKISLNANPDSLDGKEATDKLQSFHKKADGPYTSNNIIENDVILMDKLALTLAGIIETVSQSALDLNEGLTLKLLTLFRYIDDRHQMLTITGIVLEQDKENEFEEKIKASKLHDWPHFSANWQDIHEIAVPDLTPREKLAINQFLPLKEDDSIDPSKLKFKINRNEIKNQRALNNYVKYYRYIPNFQRLAF